MYLDIRYFSIRHLLEIRNYNLEIFIAVSISHFLIIANRTKVNSYTTQ